MDDLISQFIIETCQKIMDSITINDHIAMLNNTSLLLKLFDKEYIKQNKLTNLQERITGTLTNEANMRTLRMMQTIKTETDTRIEYFELPNRGSDERLFYQEEMEEDMINYEEEIRTAISKIIKEISTEEGIDTD
jgi:hypothetical protein